LVTKVNPVACFAGAVVGGFDSVAAFLHATPAAIAGA